MKKFFQNKNNQYLLLIFAFGAFLRFFRLEALTTFGGDQGQDYLNVARMIIHQRPTLLGPITHVGVYLGPLYYYLLLPFFIIFNFNPIAAPLMFALFGSLTVIAIYYLAIKFVKPTFAHITSLLYAVSPVVLESSRAPSQPHLIPFFSTLLLISSINLLSKKTKRLDALVIGICLASIIQFHFLGFPVFIFTFLIIVYSLKKKNINISYIYKLILPLIVLLFPWALFELRHQFFISHQIINYLSSGEVSLSLFPLLVQAAKLLWFSINQLLGSNQNIISAAILLTTFTALVIKKKNKNIIALVIFLFLNLISISLYFDPFDNHYVSVIYPAIFVLTVVGVQKLFKSRLSQVLLLGLIIFNLFNYNPFRSNGYTMPKDLNQKTIKQISAIIAHDTKHSKYQVASTLDGDTRAMPYRYLLEAKYNKIPLGVEKYPEAEVLYLVTRDKAEQSLKNPVWEISSIPNKKVTQTWIINNSINLHKINSLP